MTNPGRVCPVEMAGSLDNRLRKWLQDPSKILGPYLVDGMSVMDLGCGPGFFSIEMARMVGPSGRVFACDLQEGMLAKLAKKITGSDLAERIVLHQCREAAIGLSEKVDFVLAFYMVHEVRDQDGLFREIRTLLNPGGRILVVEPPLHVSRKDFAQTVTRAQKAGFDVVAEPKILFGKAVLLQKQD